VVSGFGVLSTSTAAIAIAIVRYELIDIRLVLSRTLLYAVTVSLIIATYAGLGAGFSLLVPDDAERSVSIGAAILVAIGFNPLRLALQRVIDRAFYGTRADPLGTVSRIGKGLRHDDDLQGVLEGTRSAQHLPWLGLRREPDTGPLAEAGARNASPPVEPPLTYRGEIVGALLVGLRRGEAQLHDVDRRTLDLIATPLAVALHATALSEEVRRARAATVEAAAAERVRLQRELHDGLGPTLTSVAFRADAASNLIRTDTHQAERLLGEVRGDLRAAVGSVRRVVYGLRPIELDDLGLVGALSQRVSALSYDERRGITVDLSAPQRLPPLSPAAYRIANEALANVLRHSDGRTCRIHIDAGHDLVISVVDDGRPPESWRPGVDLRSIGERAEELGGSAHAGPGASTVGKSTPCCHRRRPSARTSAIDAECRVWS
jgi:two-component system NarL family sensor kinase